MKKLLTLISILFFFSCGDKVREENTERFEDGKKKTVMKFIGEGENENMIEKKNDSKEFRFLTQLYNDLTNIHQH